MLKEFKFPFHALFSIVAFVFYLAIIWATYPFLFNHKVTEFLLFQDRFLNFIDLSFKLDQLSAFFIVVIALISSIVSIYSISYVNEYKNKYSLSKLSLTTHVFSLSMIGVVCANHVFSFLFFWELMSLSSYLLVIYDHEKKENLTAGFIYFIMTHIATAFLLIAFLILSKNSNDLSFAYLSNNIVEPQLATTAFVMFLIAAAIKSGIVPLHFWLPVAHPAAPSHVSALMSALMVKIPIFLLIKVIFEFLQPELYMGYSILAFGLISALIGILYALKENDIKKMLAYSTIENIGIILIALALSVIFYCYDAKALSSLALIACLFHCLNHAIYKSALFMGAGSIISVCHSRDLDKLGGLIKTMPQTAFFFLIPVMSIAALPLFNGFVSEWLIYQSLIKGMQLNSNSLNFIFPLVLTIVAIVTGLTFISFSKLFATAFLAYPRSNNAKNAEEVSFLMWLPVALLSTFCIYLGLNPQIFSTLWIEITKQLCLDYPDSTAYFMLSNFLSIGLLPLILTLGLISIILNKIYKSKFRRSIPWACGYEIDHKAEYNASSFSQPSLRVMKNFYKINFALFFKNIYWTLYNLCKEFRNNIQSGDLHLYLLYILITVLGGLYYAKYF